MVADGTSTRGEANARAKITEADAKLIIALRGSEYQKDTAARFGIGVPQVSAIQNGKSWAWLSR
jgi:hypothetical protein